jgi:nitrogen regulatory protein P-II 1
MKLIIAYIQPDKLNSVKKELFAREIYKVSVLTAMGCGQQKGYGKQFRGVIEEVNLLKKMRLEIAVNEDFVEKTIEAIIVGARSGEIGDGKIFILDLPECIRIRTGERGSEAIG